MSGAKSQPSAANQSTTVRFAGRGILLDIEGTVAPVSYVYDVLFPYSRDRMRTYLGQHWDSPEAAHARELIAQDAGAESFFAWRSGDVQVSTALQPLCEHLSQLMAADVKATGLKELQGLIWRDGFLSGELKSQLFADVPQALRRWSSQGMDLRIFSSGSVAAQKLFFAHTTAGDFAPLLRGYYDTTLGPKRAPTSYQIIAQQFALPADGILFISDVLAEVDAARTAGMATALAVRPGNATIDAAHTHPIVRNLDDVAMANG